MTKSLREQLALVERQRNTTEEALTRVETERLELAKPRKVYLLTTNDDIEIALLGPLQFDWAAAVTSFELAEDLYYSRWEIPPEGTSPELFNAHWVQWRTEHHEWRKEREAKFAVYNRLLAGWLVRHHNFVIADFVIE